MIATVDVSQEMARFTLDRGLVNPLDYKQAELESRQSGRHLYEILVKSNFVNDHGVKESLSNYLDLDLTPEPVVENITAHFVDVIPRNYVLDNRLIPFAMSDSEIKVAISEPSALRGISSAKLITGKKIVATVVSPIEMENLLQTVKAKIPAKDTADFRLSSPVSGSQNSTAIELKDGLKPKKKSGLLFAEKAATPEAVVAKNKAVAPVAPSDDQGGQIILFVNALIFDAVNKGASDIHIELYKDNATLRLRIDGVLQEMLQYKDFLYANYSAITTRIKIMASLDISERRLPQDGAIVTSLPNNRDIDLRVSVLPTVYGERIVMRILDREGVSFDLDKLGFPEKEFKDVTSAIDASQGMVLVTGPTGSGKSTTLYGALRRLNKPDINILTAEDPVEFTVEGIGQVQIRDDIGLTFSQALRSFLRQDPEVILVGEIRDKDTADISIKASLTGHLVLSTLHANDAISTIVRLVNMGIPGYLIGAALTLVIAQRLARKICPHCKEEHQGDHQASLMDIGFSSEEAASMKLYHGKGCEKCNNTGYKGRQGIYEVLKISDKLRAAIIDNAAATELQRIAAEEGFRNIQEIGRDMMRDGRLTLDEYRRNLVFH
ncbi:GspE/PulE family protein [Polynucleobacter sp. MWH-Braz-FAM2G]|uniref:GspE/PulE family protein n=1 Tax=Polynucleobacter sp. MWH-Braz-FAM2G TaxID=1855883 RepID=UPI001BFE9DF9|nr:GspE/PulE family protein [Polynucleobacter sp. MWH-Braz-FAM2G]QWD89926.1 Flp pilus assembly complex ATPase component TadA [Polynucleobacter sp. MWH-Braz-FAM2G]